MIKEFALQWPVLRQILHGGDGTGLEAMSACTLSLRPKNEGARVARSVCPYCAVGIDELDIPLFDRPAAFHATRSCRGPVPKHAFVFALAPWL